MRTSASKRRPRRDAEAVGAVRPGPDAAGSRRDGAAGGVASPGRDAERVLDAIIRVPDRVTGELVVPTPHHGQAEAIDALEAIDPATGLWRYPIHFWHWARKVSKDFMLSEELLHHRAFDPFEKEPRLRWLAAWDREQTEITRRSTVQLIERHPWLREHWTVYRDAFVYVEQVREPRTGGVYTVEHRVEFWNRDTKGGHGANISLKIKNEHWTDDDYSFEEALTVSPTGGHHAPSTPAITALHAQMRKGNPLFDLLERVREGDPRIAYNYVGGHGDRAPERIVPWITEAWMKEQEALYRHAPNRYRRMILNIPAGADNGIITPEELRDAIDQDAAASDTRRFGPAVRHHRRPGPQQRLDRDCRAEGGRARQGRRRYAR